MGYPSARLRARMAATVVWCPDCQGQATGVFWNAAKGRWRVPVPHDATCPSRRTQRRLRAAERLMTDQVAAAVFLADYGWRDDVIIVHRVRQAG
jgi:hypothetical protein